MQVRRRYLGLPSLLLASAVTLSSGACVRELPGEDPGKTTMLYYPTTLGVSADQRYVYVVSSNFDFRFNTGWVSVVDLEAVLSEAASAAPRPSQAITQLLKVLPLGGQLAVDATGGFAFLTHRGTGHLTLLQITEGGARLACGDAKATDGLDTEEERTDCDRQHLVDLAATPAELRGGARAVELVDPYAAALVTRETAPGSSETLALVGYLSSGWLTIYKVDPVAGTLSEPQFASLGRTALASLTVHPDASSRYVAATSQLLTSDSVRSTLFGIDLVRRRDPPFVELLSVNGQVGGNELTDLVFAPDGGRAYLTNRNPDSVVVLRSRIDTTAPVPAPDYQVVSAASLRGQPSGLAYLPRAGGDLVAVTSLDDDTLYFLAPQGDELRVVYRLEGVGQGPFAIKHVTYSGRELLLVSTFFDHGLTVVDVSASDYAAFHVVAQVRDDSIKPAKRTN